MSPSSLRNRSAPPTPIVSQPPHIPLIRDPCDYPKIAYPTIALAIFALVGLALSHYFAICGGDSLLSGKIRLPFSMNKLTTSQVMEGSNNDAISFQMIENFHLLPSFWMHFLVRFFLTYAAFTIMHDCSHDSVARPGSGVTFLNPLLGWCASLCFGAPFPVFKSIHLDHHRYTNAVEYDADLWAGGNFRGTVYSARRHPVLRFLILPLRCMTQLYHYLYHALKYLVANWPPVQFFRDVTIILAVTAFPLVSVVIPRLNYFFWLFHLPILASVLFLGMCFDYLPHRPHETTDNQILATSLITWSKPRRTTDSNRNTDPAVFSRAEIKASGIDLLTLPLLSQNFHPIHHLYPNIPFYRYSAVYWRMADVLHEAGLRAHPLFPLIISCDDE